MRCTKCNYSLFDIRERICPECGEPFAISARTFDHCGVRFCCPHCDQQYYGTDEKGHLVPIHFNCLTCHNHISMNQTIVRKPLHKVLHHRNVSSFPGFAGVTLSVCALLGLISSALVISDDSRFIPSIVPSPLQQLPASLLSQSADILLAPLLFIGGRGLYKRRGYGRTFLLIWSLSQCANVLAYIALTMYQRSSTTTNAPLEIIQIVVNDVPFIIPIAIITAILLQPRVAAIFEGWDRPPT
jgi:hypothetical protein